jgi:hypothetical protein
MLLFLYKAENGPLEANGRPQSKQCQSHSSYVGMLSSQAQLCATVWVEHVKVKESKQSVVESLLVDTRRSANRNILYLGEFVSTGICRALKQECEQLVCDQLPS